MEIEQSFCKLHVQKVLKNPIRVFLMIVLLGFLLLVGFNVTTSSLSLNFESSNKSNSAEPTVGTSKTIRSDEWMRSTPLLIGTTNNDLTDKHLTPFEFRPEASSNRLGSLLKKVIFPEQLIAQIFGSRGFAFAWWFPIFASLVTIIFVAKSFGLRFRHAFFSALILLLSPQVSWWSYWPLASIWPSALAFLCALRCSKLSSSFQLTNDPARLITSHRIQMAFLILAGGISLSRLPFVYQPWSLPTLCVIAALFIDRSRQGSLRNNLKYGTLIGLLSATFAGLWYQMNRSSYAILAETVYPGARRSSGGNLQIPMFSGPINYFLSSSRSIDAVATNQSESSLGWAILFVVALLVLFFSYLLRRGDERSNYLPEQKWTATIAVSFVLFSWSLFSWPKFMLNRNILKLIPSDRMFQILSTVIVIPATIILFTRLREFQKDTKLRVAGFLSVVVFLCTLYSALNLRVNYPQLSVEFCWLVSGIFATLVFAMLRFSESIFALGAVTLFAFVSVSMVNPVAKGQGDLVNSDSAHMLYSTVRGSSNPRGRIATDHMFLDALVAANGLYQMSGQQGFGPNESSYRKIDPQLELRDLWNRGASSLIFLWDENRGEEVGINVLGSGDVFQIVASPCNKGLQTLGLGWIISTTQLNSECLVEQSTFFWTDAQRWLYQVTVAN